MRSALRRDAGGKLFCEYEGEGLDATALDLELAASIAPPMEYEAADSRLEPRSTDVAPVHPELVGPTGGNP